MISLSDPRVNPKEGSRPCSTGLGAGAGAGMSRRHVLALLAKVGEQAGRQAAPCAQARAAALLTELGARTAVLWLETRQSAVVLQG